jgi:hypothetical protein
MVAPAPQPQLENWLLGEWQGPTQGCPPGAGVKFTDNQSIVYYKGKINATLPVAYRVEPGTVTVSTIGPDGITQDYVYQKTGSNSMIIVGVPQNMPRTLLGAAHRRCGVAPVKTLQADMTAPAAVYPDSTPPVSDNQISPKASAQQYAATAAPIAGAPAAAPSAPDLPESTPPVSAPEPESEPAPAAAAAPIIPELKPDDSAAAQTPEAPQPEEPVAPTPEVVTPEATVPAETVPAANVEPPVAEAVTRATEAGTEAAPALPKSTTPASTADKAKKAEEAKAAAEAEAQAKIATETPPITAPEPTKTTTPEPEATAESAPAPTAAPEPTTAPAPSTESTAEAAPEPEPVTAEPTTTEPTATETPPPVPEPTQQAAAATTAPAPEPSTTQEELAEEALASGNTAKALEIWEPLAKAGNTGIAVNVAGMYEFGQKLPQDYAKAAEWYGIAAEQGDSYAQYKMGRAYTRGTGLPIDRVQAYKWLTVAMQSLSNAKEGKTGKASKMEIENALSDIVGALSQSEMTKASQMVKQYNEQHHIAE